MRKDQSSYHLFIWIMVFATIGVFLLWVMMISTPSIHKKSSYDAVLETTKPPETTTPPPIIDGLKIFLIKNDYMNGTVLTTGGP